MECIGKYQITGELGSGGFGRVYKAFDPTVGRVVAIKVLNVQDDPALVMRFEAEAKTSANLQHKNIVIVHEFGEQVISEQSKKQFLVMEYLSGRNLQDIINEQTPIGPLEKLVIMSEVAQGLQFAHEHGVVHRDVKPANIMRLSDGSVKIMDFGIARLMRSANTRLTQAGIMIGTPQYMAPEQFTSDTADERCDVWAYGVVFYEFLAGVNPFHGDNAPQMIFRVTAEDPPPISAYVPGLPPSLDAILKRLLAKTRDERYASLEDVLFDLEPVILELKRAQVDDLLRTAATLIQEEHLDEALTVVRKILELDQSNLQARKMRKELPELIRVQSLQQRVKAFEQQAETDAERRDFAAALAKLGEALRLDKSNQRIRARLQELLSEQERVNRAAALITEARAEYLQSSFTVAIEKAKQAAQTDPENPDAAVLVDEIGQAIRQRDIEARRKAGLSKAKGLILVQEYENAVSILQDLAERHTDDPEVRERLEEAKRLQAIYAAQLKTDAAILESRDLIRRGLYQRAIDELDALDKEILQKAQVSDLLTYAREQLAAEKRTAEVEDLIRQASEAPVGDFELCLSLAERALSLSPGNEKALRLRKNALAARQAEQESRAIRRSVQECRALLLAGKLDQALENCAELKRRSPDHPNVVELDDDLVRLVRERNERKEREMQARLREVERLLDQGDPGTATKVLNTLTVHYPERSLAPLRARAVAEEREQKKREAIRSTVARSAELARGNRWDQALLELDRGLATWPDSPELLEEKARVSDLKRRDAIDRALVQARELAAGKSWDQALAELDRGLASWPDASELLEEKERTSQLKTRDARDATIGRARELAKGGRWDEAQAELNRGLVSWPNSPELLEEKQRLAQAFANERERSRREAVEAAIGRAAKLANAKSWDDAQAELDRGLASWPESPELLAEKQRLARAAADERERIKREGIEATIGRAAKLATAQRWDEAQTELDRGLASWPDSRELLAEKQRLARAAADERDRAKREAIGAVLAKGRELAGAKRLDEAQQELDRGLASWPGSPELLAEKERVTQLKTREGIEAAIAKARDLTNGKRWDQAQAELERGLKSWPGSPELLEELGRLASAVAAERDRIKREAIQATLSRAGELAGGKRWDQSLAELDRGLASWPDALELIKEKGRVTQLKVTQEAAEEIERRMARHELDAAIAAADSLLAKFPGEAAIIELREKGRKQIEFERLLKDAESLVFQDELERATPMIADLLRRVPGDANAHRLKETVERKQKRRQDFATVEQLIRRQEFQKAHDLAIRILLEDPEDATAAALLRRIERETLEFEREQRIERARADASEFTRHRQFAQAIQLLEKAAGEFPDEQDLQDDLRRTREAQAQFERKEAASRGRAELDALMKQRRFEDAIEKARQLAADYPEEAFQQDVQAAISAKELRDRRAQVESEVAEIEKLFRQGEAESVRKRAKSLLASYEEPRARELLIWSEKTLADVKDLKKKTAGPRFDRRWIAAAAVLAVLIAIWRLWPTQAVVEIKVSPGALSFSYQQGAAVVPAQKLQLTGKPSDEAWLITVSDQWFKAPGSQVGDGEISVQVDPLKLTPGTHTGVLTVSPKDRPGPTATVKISVTVLQETPPPNQQTQLQIQPTELAFSYQRGAPAQLSKTLKLTGKPNNETWVVKVTDTQRFNVTPKELTGDGVISVQVVPNLPAGAYITVITISGKRSPATQALVPITLNVLPEPISTPATVQLGVKPDSLSFSYKRGGPAPVAQTLQVTIKPAGEVWQAVANAPWIKAAPAEGTGDGSISIQVDPQKLGVGDSTGMVTVTSKRLSGAPVSVPIRLSISETPPPPTDSITDCKGPNYFGVPSADVRWTGFLQPGQTVTIDRKNMANPPGSVIGSRLPGCEVTVTSNTKGVDITEFPTLDNRYGRVALKNNSPTQVSNPSFKWTVK